MGIDQSSPDDYTQLLPPIHEWKPFANNSSNKDIFNTSNNNIILNTPISVAPLSPDPILSLEASTLIIDANNHSIKSIKSNTPSHIDLKIPPLHILHHINDSNKTITSTTPPNFNRNTIHDNNSNDITEIIDTHTNINPDTNTHFDGTLQMFEQNEELLHGTIDPLNSVQAIVNNTKKCINHESIYYELPVLCDGGITKLV